MGTRVSPLGSDAVVEIADELVEQYVQQGWTRSAEPEEKRKPGRPAKKE
jgi:hypothetical protein